MVNVVFRILGNRHCESRTTVPRLDSTARRAAEIMSHQEREEGTLALAMARFTNCFGLTNQEEMPQAHFYSVYALQP